MMIMAARDRAVVDEAEHGEGAAARVGRQRTSPAPALECLLARRRFDVVEGALLVTAEQLVFDAARRRPTGDRQEVGGQRGRRRAAAGPRRHRQRRVHRGRRCGGRRASFPDVAGRSRSRRQHLSIKLSHSITIFVCLFICSSNTFYSNTLVYRGKSGPALGGTEYRLMPSACQLIVRAKL